MYYKFYSHTWNYKGAWLSYWRGGWMTGGTNRPTVPPQESDSGVQQGTVPLPWPGPITLFNVWALFRNKKFMRDEMNQRIIYFKMCHIGIWKPMQFIFLFSFLAFLHFKAFFRGKIHEMKNEKTTQMFSYSKNRANFVAFN